MKTRGVRIERTGAISTILGIKAENHAFLLNITYGGLGHC
jgi:hypothetical protein